MTNAEEKSGTKRKILLIVGILLCVILVPLLIINCIFIVKGALQPDKVPMIFGSAPLIVESGSMENDDMEPNIRFGDLIFVKEVDVQTLEVGDVITFWSGKAVVTHRIVAIEMINDVKVLRTKGDRPGNSIDEDPVPLDKVVGIYKSKISGLGSFILFLKEPLGIFVFIGVPVLAYIAYDVIRRVNSAKRDNRTAELEAEIARLKAAAEVANNGTPQQPQAQEEETNSPKGEE